MWLARLLFAMILATLVVGLFHVREGFENAPVLKGDAMKRYHDFVAFYNPFMETWEKAITTAAGLERPAPKEGDPIPTFTHEELNRYVQLLSQKLGTPLPQVTTPLPGVLTTESMNSFIVLLEKTPADAFLRATEWMNARIKESHAEKDAALKGAAAAEGFRLTEGFYVLEGFTSPETCSEFIACLDDPAVLDKIAAAQEKRQAKKSATQQDALLEKMNAILGQGPLQGALQTNAGLRAESDRIQNQAQSGEMLQSMDLPSEGPPVKYDLPAGAGALDDLKKKDPAQYKEYEKSQKPLLELKQLLNQINGGLR